MNGIGENITMGEKLNVGAIMNPSISEHLAAPAFKYRFDCIGPSAEHQEEYLAMMARAEKARLAGNFVEQRLIENEASFMLDLKWTETIHNLVTNVGRNDVLDKYFKGSAYTAAWYLGLAGAGTKAAADTLPSHAGWSEVTPYAGNRPAITFGTTASQSNTATAVAYTINATATVAGAFIASVNTGTGGTLYSAGDFTASRSVASGDTLNVTPTVTS